jgi:hypothetical protein
MSDKVVIGFFPKQICYVGSIKQNVAVGCEWDIDYGANGNNKTEEVIPAYPVNNDDKKSIAAAVSWAEQNIRIFNKNALLSHTKEVIDNNIITNVRLLKLETRGNRGTVYKALVNNYYVDIREDVVLDTVLQEGVEVGGILKGEFIWAKCGSQIKLVRKGSELYKLIAESESKINLKLIPKKKLEVGGVYRTKKKDTFIYLGNVNTTQFISSDSNQKPNYWNNYDYRNYENDKSCLNFKNQEMKNKMLFYKIYKHQNVQEEIKSDHLFDNYYKFDFKQSHSLIEKIDQLTLDKDIVEKVRSGSLKKIKQLILNYTSPAKGSNETVTIRELSNNIRYMSCHLNVYLSTEKPKELFDVQKYLLFS